MKILLVNYEYPDTTPNCGGGGEVTKHLKTGLEARDHTVRVLTDNAGTVADWSIRGPHNAGHYATFPFRSAPLLADNVAWADVVHGHFTLPSSLLLPRYCNRYDTPLVVSVMGADIYDPTRFGWLRPVTKELNRYICRRADRVVAPSHDMARRTQDQTMHIPEVIHYGIDPEEWEWEARSVNLDESVWLLSVCRLVERKNLDTAIDAVQELRERGIDARYTIAGTGPKADMIHSRKAEEGLDWLYPVGYVDDLQQTFDGHDVFFLPSTHEAFGVVFLEALASGLPVVTSRDGGQVDIVSKAGVRRVGHYPGAYIGHTWESEAECYADLLEQAIADYSEVQANTEGYVREYFHQATMVEAYESVYHEVQDE